MLFVNLNLNLKQARISIKIPEMICKNKINLEVKQNGELILNLIYKLIIGSNLSMFKLKPRSLRQFTYSKIDNHFYNLNFVIECDFVYTFSTDLCTVRLPSDNEMATDWAYCCGNNQEKHLQNLNSLDELESARNLNNDLINFNQLFILFSKQQLFTKFLIESTNRTEYLIVHKLGNRGLIAFDQNNDYETFFDCIKNRNDDLKDKLKGVSKDVSSLSEDVSKDNSKDVLEDVSEGVLEDNSKDVLEDNSKDVPFQISESDKLKDKSNLKSKNFDLIESIFVEFIYLDYELKKDDVKKYRHSFEYEFLKLDNKFFDKLFQRLHQVNKLILPLKAKFNVSTKFNYSYLLKDL